MSTRVEGAEPAVILVTAKATLVAGSMYLVLTVREESENLWCYNMSGPGRNNRAAFGKFIVTGYMTALRRAAEICGAGYQPGTIERGLLDSFARDALR